MTTKRYLIPFAAALTALSACGTAPQQAAPAADAPTATTSPQDGCVAWLRSSPLLEQVMAAMDDLSAAAADRDIGRVARAGHQAGDGFATIADGAGQSGCKVSWTTTFAACGRAYETIGDASDAVDVARLNVGIDRMGTCTKAIDAMTTELG